MIDHDRVINPTKEQVDEFKELMKKEYGVEYGDEEAREAAINFLGFTTLLVDLAVEEYKRQERLKKEPKGFLLEGSYTCCVCRSVPEDQKIWYDKHGMKCFHCQNALDRRIIPVSVCHNDDNKVYFTSYDLQHDLKIHAATVGKLIRQKKLIARNIPVRGGSGIHYQLFLKKDNVAFLKSLIRTKTKDGTSLPH